MSKPKLYISSTYKDLKDFRIKIREFLDKNGSNDFELCQIMEHMYDDGTSTPFLDTCIKEVSECDIYIIVIGDSAGSLPPPPNDSLTYTEHEYQCALDKKKKIYRLKKKNFEADKCPSIELYDRFVEQFKGLNVKEFSNDLEFENEFLKIFYNEKPSLKIADTEDSLMSKINRENQLKFFNRANGLLKTNKLQYYYYLFNQYDFAHLLNYRIINSELKENQLERRNQFFIPVSKVFSEEWDYTIDELSQKFFRLDALEGISKFMDNFNKSNHNKLLVPILICHETETNEETYDEVNKFLHLFEGHKGLMLPEKQIYFFIGIQTVNEINQLENIEQIFEGLTILPQSNLKSLENIKKSDILNWLLSNIESNSTLANQYLETHFSNANDMNTMDEVCIMADEFLKNAKSLI